MVTFDPALPDGTKHVSDPGHVDDHNSIVAALVALNNAKAEGTGEVEGWFDVTGYGAVGDGTTDDTAEIQAAINAAGVGGTVYFPPTSSYYKISATLAPLDSQTWIGTYSPRYVSSEYMPVQSGTIRAGSSFTGSALVYTTPAKKGLTFRNLCFQGNGVDGTLDGLDMGPDSGGERQWVIDKCQFSAFGGAALCGNAWVLDIRDSHFVQNGYAWRPGAGADSASKGLDVRMIGCQVYFNKLGGIYLDGTQRHGGVSIIGCRIERSGSNPADPNNNRVNNADGIRIVKATGIIISGNYSDANSGYGLNIAAAAASDVGVVTCTGNIWNRDSTGGQSVPESRAGIRLKYANRVAFHGDKISYGSPNDAGGGTVTPQYGLELEDTNYVEWFGSIDLNSSVIANAFRLIGTNWHATLNEPRSRSSMTFWATSDRPANATTGTCGFNTTTGKPEWYSGSGWVDAAGGTP